jgi:hypothetical protein
MMMFGYLSERSRHRLGNDERGQNRRNRLIRALAPENESLQE